MNSLRIAVTLGLCLSLTGCNQGSSPPTAAATSTTVAQSEPVAIPQSLEPQEAGLPVPEGEQLQAEEAKVALRLKEESPSVTDGKYPLYRQLSPRGPHHYTSSEARRHRGLREGYKDEGIVGYVLGAKSEGSVPLFHLVGKRGDHLYTTSQEEARNAVERYDYRYFEIVGFVYPAEREGLVPVYRHFNGSTHFYTSDPAESAEIPEDDWDLEGVACYVFAP